MNNRDLPELRILVEVVRRRSFAEAAAALGVTPSAVSQSIARLEKRVGRTLLDRTTRRIRPTPLSEELAAAALRAIAQVDDVYRLIDADAERPGRSVRLSVSRVAMELLVEPVLAGFFDRHPGVTLEISVEDRLIDLFDDRYDAGIRRGGWVNDTMVARRVSPDDDLIIVAAPAYLQRRAAPLAPGELRDHDCIQIRRRRLGTTPPWRLLYGQARTEIAVAGSLIVDTPDIARNAAVRGVGIARLSRAYVRRELRSGTLIHVLDQWAEPISGFFLYYPARPAPSAALSAFRHWLCREPGELNVGV